MQCSYGIVLKKLDLKDKETVDIFVEAVNAEPLLWSAWIELSLLISDREMVCTVGHKKCGTLLLSLYIYQLLTDCKNSFTGTLYRQFAIM